MENTTQQGNEMVKLFSVLMETAKQFWQAKEAGSGVTANGQKFAFNFNVDNEEADERYKTYRTWETSVNNLLSFMKLMTAPQNQEALVNCTGTYFEALADVAGDSMENLVEIQSQLINSFARVGEHIKAYNLDELDHDSFESFRELYRSEFQKYFNIPKIGLPREFHEQLSALIDRSNIFYSHLVELVYLFIVPIEKANREMQLKLKRMLEKGEFPDDYKQAYSEWIRILEGHYMELLKSKDYTHVLNDFIGALAAYKNIRNEVVNVFMKDMQIPTNKDMDEVYRDIYHMKRKIKDLTNQVERLQQELKTI